jgi:CrcB protein
MPTLSLYAAIAAGGAIGTVLRYRIGLWFAGTVGEAMPWGTIAINVTGSFVIGLFAALFEGGRLHASPEWRSFVLVGLCGGYTTFSSFSLQTLTLVQTGHPGRALANVLVSVTLCLVAVWLGFVAAGSVGPSLKG